MTEEVQRTIIDGLYERGYSVDNINDLLKLSLGERELVPYLLEILDELTDERDKEYIVRCMGIRGLREAVPKLLSEFQNTKNNYYRWAIGNSINIIHDMTIEKELIELSSDKKYGTGRQMMVLALGSYKTDSARKCLAALLDDEEVRGHALRALGKCGTPEVLPKIEIYCSADNTWIRKEAVKAVERIRKKEIAFAESRISGKIPEVYKQFLRKTDGMIFNQCVLYDAKSIVEMYEINEFAKYAPNYISIGNDSGGRELVMKAETEACMCGFLDAGAIGTAEPDEWFEFVPWLENGCVLGEEKNDKFQWGYVSVIHVPDDKVKFVAELKKIFALTIPTAALLKGLNKLPYVLAQEISSSKAEKLINKTSFPGSYKFFGK